jgi:hypothetical protein
MRRLDSPGERLLSWASSAAYGILCACMLTTLPACTASPIAAPRTRIGGLPFPGLLTLFSLADPRALGLATYEKVSDDQKTECSRGILYAERAGFLDVAHIREAMDWTRFVSQCVVASLRRGERTLTFLGRDKFRLQLSFRYPKDWKSVAWSKGDEAVSELALRIGQRVVIDMMTWHEIITWFGHGATPLWSEKPSAFTYEDTMSHIVGIRAAGRAIRNSTGDWNVDATWGLDEELRRMGVMSIADAALAVELVRGHWWKAGVCTRRMLDIGQQDDRIWPWLVAGMPGGNQTPAYRLPDIRNVQGNDFEGIYALSIDLSAMVPKRLRKLIPGNSKFIDPLKDFPRLLETVRYEVRSEFGLYADQPNDG